MDRLNPDLFAISDRVKEGYYSDAYFNRMKTILKGENLNPVVMYQVFQRQHAVLCGIDEAIAILKQGCDDPSQLKIKALREGDLISPKEVVMTVETPVQNICHLETTWLGVLKRPTAIASNVKKLVEAANGKPLLFFAARFDHYKMQSIDGYAALKGGASGVSSDANAWWQGEKGIGTMPHALIAAFGGDTVKASLAFDKHMPDNINRIPLVDFDNDCIGTSIAVVDTFREQAYLKEVPNGNPQDSINLPASKFIGTGNGKIYGVRFDTSGNMRDRSVTPTNRELSLGVCPDLVCKARHEFDFQGWHDLKISVSGGFNVKRIQEYEAIGVPVDIYCVGSNVYRDMTDYDFTADIVRVDGKPLSKIGRWENKNDRLEEVKI